MDLASLRQDIDNINEKIIDLIAERAELSRKVAKEKQSAGSEVLDLEREEELLKNVATIAKNKNLDEEFVKNIFKMIMENSRRIQGGKK